jgi:hypothetical protein
MELIDRPTMEIVGLAFEINDDQLDNAMPFAWSQLFDRADAIIGRTGTAFLELSTDLGGGRHRKVLGAQVVAGTSPPPEMEAELVYEATWIHERHHGPPERIPRTYARMLDHAADHGLHADGVRLDIGDGADGPHDLFLRITGPAPSRPGDGGEVGEPQRQRPGTAEPNPIRP